MRTALFACVLLAAGCANLSPMQSARTLADAEAAFAAHSVRDGMRAAFLAHFAADGVVVREGWTNSNAHLANQPNPPIVLDWRPVHVETAASGELGLSTGPWKITSTAKADAPPTYGQFVSVWRREGDAWKVAVDLGIAHPQPALWDAPLEAAVTRGTPATSPLAAAEEAFARDARAGLREAYARHAASDLRLYRAGAAPALRKAVALARDWPDAGGWTWTVERTETARSGDFGYARGRYAAAGAPDKPLGYFLRVWRFEAPAWRIVLDVVNPAASK